MNQEHAIAINKAMLAPDDFVLEINYTDQREIVTKRTISPIKYLSDKSILALCLGRETPRRFDLSRISGMKLIDARTVLMPVEIQVVYDPNGPDACTDTNSADAPTSHCSD